MADDILRTQRQFHETLYQPQLEFTIQTIAPSQSVTGLIGSLLAESAFKGGSYRLVTENVDFKEFSVQYNSVPPVIADSSDLFTGVYQLYSPLEKLLHTATVEELSGLFCLPTASVTSPCCIRKNTDPPDTSKDELIFLGNDRTPFVANDKGLIRGLQK